MTDRNRIVYIALDWDTREIKGVYPDIAYAADAAFCLHTANDDIHEGTQTTIVTATYYHDASSALEREEKLREQAELKIPTDTITPLDPEEGEPL